MNRGAGRALKGWWEKVIGKDSEPDRRQQVRLTCRCQGGRGPSVSDP